jgi:hypothetical protein
MVLIALAQGCASTSESRDEHLALMRENYALCALAYKQNRIGMMHVGHTHDERGVRGDVEYSALFNDLMYNKCHAVLGEHWAE